MPIVRTLDLSTSHVKSSDLALLESHIRPPGGGERGPVAVDTRGEYGFWINVPTEDALADTAQELRKAGYSDAFTDLLANARARGCEALCLDCDADEEAGLPTFEHG
ncbi:hypothetical protein CKO28_00280 [Rhodovibrio sodomensis]|uniref:DUF5983 domain-containing protein n=1 Tax=Rhodovibrio sodomensis TaxID=1088 RepID=A0ABS1D924_9PROT|nr:hypothetical protein [Rhodovibrio sodomensis]MBK1666476.1 hypothetical protein [Rhodovibrio sodomensis]